MQSRRDQVQAYFFVVGRLVAAVTHGRPDSLEAPNGRLNKGTVLGIVIGAVIAGIFGIIGIFVPGGDSSWRHEGAIVMNEDNGARYVFLQGQLRPVLNYSSARLVVGKGGTGQVYSVSQKSLGDTPVGQPIGIPDAPDSLPAANKLHAGPWTVCAQPAGAEPTLSLLLGEPAGARLDTTQSFLVSTPDGTIYLIWQGKRHRVPDRVTQEALGYGDTQPVPVTVGWLNPVPPGKDLGVPATEGAGDQGPRVEGRTGVVGQVYEVRNPALDSDQFYLLRADGVTPLSTTTAALLLAHPSTKDAYDGPVAPVVVGPAALSGVPVSGGADLTEGLPPEPPETVTPPRESVPCMRFGPSATGEVHAVAELLPATTVANAAMPVVRNTTGKTADRVAVPAGGGVLARELPAPGANPGTAYLVTETGIRYPLGGAEVVAALGYDESTAMNVPGQLLGLLPVGPLLSTEAALRTHANVS